MCFYFTFNPELVSLLLAFLSNTNKGIEVAQTGKQEYSSRTLGATWGIISAIMIPIVVVLICIGWRILLRRKAEEKEEEYLGIKTRPIDPDESVKINSDDESIPYKKDSADDSPEPTEGVKVVDTAENYPYEQQYGAPTQPAQRQWAGETEIN